MRSKNLGTILILLALLFIAIGDRFLPHPFNSYSRNTRTHINEFLLGLFPDKELKKLGQQRESQVKGLEQRIEQLERRAEPSPK